jgi:hypothetical protein
LHEQGFLSQDEVAYVQGMQEMASEAADRGEQFDLNAAIAASQGEGFSGEGDFSGAGELAGAGANGSSAGAAGGEGTALSALTRQVKQLSARLHSKEMAEEAAEYDTLLSTIEGNLTALASRNEELEVQLEATRHALRTSGARSLKPAHGARLFEEKVGKKNEFEGLVSKLVAEGKTRGEAVTLAAKQDPDAYGKYLEGRGLIKTVEDPA